MTVIQQKLFLAVCLFASEQAWKCLIFTVGFESSWSLANTPSWLSLLFPHLQSLIQEVTLEDAQHTGPWPQPGSASAAAVTWGKPCRGLKKLIFSFLLTCRDKPYITDECCNQSDMKSIWWEQFSLLIVWALMLFKQLQLTSFLSQACTLATRQSHDSFCSFPVAWWIFNSFIKTVSASARRLVTVSHFGV